jgi:hypothetical protein
VTRFCVDHFQISISRETFFILSSFDLLLCRPCLLSTKCAWRIFALDRVSFILSISIHFKLLCL